VHLSVNASAVYGVCGVHYLSIGTGQGATAVGMGECLPVAEGVEVCLAAGFYLG
jgi:hypothetical protein